METVSWPTLKKLIWFRSRANHAKLSANDLDLRWHHLSCHIRPRPRRTARPWTNDIKSRLQGRQHLFFNLAVNTPGQTSSRSWSQRSWSLRSYCHDSTILQLRSGRSSAIYYRATTASSQRCCTTCRRLVRPRITGVEAVTLAAQRTHQKSSTVSGGQRRYSRAIQYKAWSSIRW